MSKNNKFNTAYKHRTSPHKSPSGFILVLSGLACDAVGQLKHRRRACTSRPAYKEEEANKETPP